MEKEKDIGIGEKGEVRRDPSEKRRGGDNWRRERAMCNGRFTVGEAREEAFQKEGHPDGKRGEKLVQFWNSMNRKG